MRPPKPRIDRRALLRLALVGAASSALPDSSLEAAAADRVPRVAAVFTVLRFRSHAYNILENFVRPYLFNGQLTEPGVQVVSFYADQFPTDDLAREASKALGIPLFDTIHDALCVGTNQLAVDGVLLIGEHGEYPYNARGQHLYPRKRFFDETVAVMQQAKRFVPVFNDKHLAWRWDWARQMYDVAREKGIPLLAGSSVPLAERRPPLELPAEAEIEEAVAIHGGGLESYDFHALEVLQSFVEARRGGETGIASVELLTGQAYEQALDAGRWSLDLVEAAMHAESAMQARRQPFPQLGVLAAGAQPDAPRPNPAPPEVTGTYAIQVLYRDGLRATVLRMGSDANRWNFACRLKGEAEPRATAIYNSPWGNRGLFKALSHAIQYMIKSGQEPYPAERTLLTTGAVEAVMLSHELGRPIATPHLDIAYTPGDWSRFRETGKSWSKITADTPQPIPFGAPEPVD